jgi:hypothetical protein
VAESLSAISNLRGALIFNGFLYIDDFLLKALKSSIDIIETSKSKEDVLIYFQTIFSHRPSISEKKIKEDLDLNPITDSARAFILKGVLNVCNLKDLIKFVKIPILAVSSSKDSLIPNFHSSDIAGSTAPEITSDNIEEIFHSSRTRMIITTLDSGHDVLEVIFLNKIID